MSQNLTVKFRYDILAMLFPLIILFVAAENVSAQGTWTPVIRKCPDTTAGVMILLSDGSVIVKTKAGIDGIGNKWDKLTPDINGSYVNGTWSTIAPMQYSRLYFSSRVLKDGKVYVAGGEYGTGKNRSEIYDPLNDTWTLGPVSLTAILDANSELLPDGRVLQALVGGGSMTNVIYNPATNTYSNAPACLGNQSEVSWLKLPDNSILTVDNFALRSERYIPSTNQWVLDTPPPANIYDSLGHEAGAAFLLPNGKGFFLGANSKTLIYTPSGTVSPGTWTVGANIPNGLGAPDAAAAMMVDGKILCAFSPAPGPFTLSPADTDIFKSPTYFYEYDYIANAFTPLSAPNGAPYLNNPCFYTNMLDLPDGTVLFSNQYADAMPTDTSRRYDQLYVYKPAGQSLASGKPTINNVIKIDCDNYLITGTLFNGISEGAGYGDDWQMATNYPIVRIMANASVFYARTSNWNSNGVQRGAAIDSAIFTLPASLPEGTYSLDLSANGIASTPIMFSTCNVGVGQVRNPEKLFRMFPNPAKDNVTIECAATIDHIKVTNLLGELVYEIRKPQSGNLSTEKMSAGIYYITVLANNTSSTQKLVISK